MRENIYSNFCQRAAASDAQQQYWNAAPSSVSREIQRSWAKYKPKAPDNPYWYNHWHAQNLYTTAKTHQRRREKKYVHRDSSCNTIHPDHIIPEWPEEIKQRKRFGDWERNTDLRAMTSERSRRVTSRG